MSFICGSFQSDEDDFDTLLGISSPSRSASRRSKRHSHSIKSNPYSDRGLDKFSALLADLDDRRRRILTQKGSEDVSLVRFVYSNATDCRPIVVKLRKRRQAKKAVEPSSRQNQPLQARVPEAPEDRQVVAGSAERKSRVYGRVLMRLEDLRKPSYYLPVFLVLIMLSLAFFGRSVSILCASIAWYLLPAINDWLVRSKNKLKKEYRRKTSAKISSPRSVLQGPASIDGHSQEFLK